MSTKRRWRLPAITLVLWLLIGGGVGPFAGKLTEVIKNDNAAFLPANAEATLATNISRKLIGEDQPITGTLVVESTQGLSEQDKTSFNQVLSQIPQLELKEGMRVQDILYPIPATPVVSQDGKAVTALLFFDPVKATKPFADSTSPIAVGVEKIRAEFKKVGIDGHVGGFAGLFGDLVAVFSSINGTLLLATVGVVLLILILVYRSFLLPIVVLASVGLGDAMAQAVVYFLAKSEIITLNGQAQGILLILVFGVGTDYSLLIVSRFREELRNYESKYDAMRVTLRGVFEPILASAATVSIGLFCLSFSVLSSNKSTGPVCAAGVISAFLSVMTMLPALLVLIGRRVFWPKRPTYGSEHPEEKGIWGKVARGVGKHPNRAWIVGTALILILCAFLPTLKATGLDKSFTKRTDSVIADEAVARHFPGGTGTPVSIVTPVEKLAEVLRVTTTVPGIASAAPFTGFAIGGAPSTQPKVVDGYAGVDAVTKYAAYSEEARAVVVKLRQALHSQVGKDVLVGGFTAINVDTQEASRRDRNVIIPIVLVVIFLILMLLLRSIIAPIILMVTVVASYFATLGACAIVFNHIFKFPGADTSFPLFAFTFLVALGVDYNIFLMTRVREESMAIGTRPGTLKALTVTGGVITSAGVVLAATFGVLGVLPIIFLTQIGFAVGFGVLLDTIIVRSVIVPALVYDFGAKVWWPSKLRRDPALSNT